MDQRSPVFPGVHELLKLLRLLRRRPPFLARNPRLKVRGDVPLPLVCLIGPHAAGNDFLQALEGRLRATEPRAPYALVDAATAREDTGSRWRKSGHGDRQMPLLPVLDELCNALGRDRYGARRLDFRRYRLAEWLTGQRLDPAGNRDDQAEVVALLRRWRGSWAGRDEAARGELPGPGSFSAAALLWAVRLLILRWFGRRSYGIVPEARWFMRRQPYLIPKHSTDFFGFAERLTSEFRKAENPDQVEKLLVHAFLEDLRVAYRRRRRSFLPRRGGWRRTAYVTALIGNAGDDDEHNGGFRLLHLINNVRNETGDLDPLLVVAACERMPTAGPSDATTSADSAASAASPTPAGSVTSAASTTSAEFTDSSPDDAYDQWLDRLPTSRQRLADDARFLGIPLPPAGAGTDKADQKAWRPGAVDLRPPAPPLLARRLVLESVLVLALVAAAAYPLVRWQAYDEAGCSLLRARLDGGVAVRLHEIAPGDRQCVGYSDGPTQVFGSNARLTAAQQTVFGHNAEVAARHRAQPGRPMISLIYFAGLTHAGSDLETDHAVAEELEGMAMVQQRQLGAPSSTEPLLRVIVANGGRAMSAADDVTRDMLIPLLDRDPTIKAVIGLDRTVAQTEAAIRDLGAAGVPTVGTTLTGTGLDRQSPLYFPLVPDNTQQARLVAGYLAAQVRAGSPVRTLTIAHPELAEEQPDTYIRTLVDEIRAVVGREVPGVTVTADDLTWQRSPSGELSPPCPGAGWAAARDRTVYFYAGRETDYRDFLEVMSRGCPRKASIPQIIADDAVTRVVAQAAFRNDPTLAGVDVSYVALGGLVVLAGTDCVTRGLPAGTLADKVPLQQFCDSYTGLRKRLDEQLPAGERPTTPYPGERVGVAYDAAGLFVAAASQGGRHRWHRATLAQLLRDPGFAHLGASGRITFTPGSPGRRAITILRQEAAEPDPECVFMLGEQFEATAAAAPGTGCP